MIQALQRLVALATGRIGDPGNGILVATRHARSQRAGVDNTPRPLDTRQARYAIFLSLGTEWVSRRVETFTFLDAATVRRRMSVDFTFPLTPNLDAGEQALVPLMLLAKEDLRNLDVSGPDGAPLPVLNTAENGAVAMQGLVSYLNELAPDDGLSDAERAALEEIVYNRPGEREPVAAQHLAPEGALGRRLQRAEPRVSRELATLIEELEGAFMLLVPIDYAPDRRVICKIAYDAANRPQRDAPMRSRAYTFANRFVSSLGWTGRMELFDNLAVGMCRSYHAEAVPPRDAYVSDAWLSVRPPGKSVDEEPITDDHDFRPHVRVSNVDRTAQGSLSVSIRARSHELVAPLALTSTVISVALALLPRYLRSIDRQTFAAVLLVPFALAAYYIRGQENSYVTRMLRGVRLIAALPVACAVYALILEAIGNIPPAKGMPFSPGVLGELHVLFPVAAVATIVLWISWLSAPVGRRIIRPLMRKIAGRARRVLREHPDSTWRRLGPAIPAIIVAVVAIVVLSLALACGVAEWVRVARPPSGSMLIIWSAL